MAGHDRLARPQSVVVSGVNAAFESVLDDELVFFDRKVSRPLHLTPLNFTD